MFMFCSVTDDAANPAEARAQHRFEVLRELVEIGMELARDVRRQALEPAEPDAPAVDHGLRFARIARAVRQTLALEEKFEAERRERREKVEKVRVVDARVRGLMRKIKVGEIVERVLENETDGEFLTEMLSERLEDAEDTDFADHSLGELVAGICRDLGVTVDWTRWGDEVWAIEARAVEARTAQALADDAPEPAAAPRDEPALVLSG
jgi:hypothetical protein